VCMESALEPPIWGVVNNYHVQHVSFSLDKGLTTEIDYDLIEQAKERASLQRLASVSNGAHDIDRSSPAKLKQRHKGSNKSGASELKYQHVLFGGESRVAEGERDKSGCALLPDSLFGFADQAESPRVLDDRTDMLGNFDMSDPVDDKDSYEYILDEPNDKYDILKETTRFAVVDEPSSFYNPTSTVIVGTVRNPRTVVEPGLVKVRLDGGWMRGSLPALEQPTESVDFVSDAGNNGIKDKNKANRSKMSPRQGNGQFHPLRHRKLLIGERSADQQTEGETETLDSCTDILTLSKLKEDSLSSFNPSLDHQYHKMLTDSVMKLKSSQSTSAAVTSSAARSDAGSASSNSRPVAPIFSALPLQDGALRVACVQAGSLPRSMHSLCVTKQICAYCLRPFSVAEMDALANERIIGGDADPKGAKTKAKSKRKNDNVLDDLLDTEKRRGKDVKSPGACRIVSIQVGAVEYYIHQLCSFALSLPMADVLALNYPGSECDLENVAGRPVPLVECSSMYQYDEESDADCDICGRLGGILFFYTLSNNVSDLAAPSEEGWLGHVPCLLWLLTSGLLYDRRRSTIGGIMDEGVCLGQIPSDSTSEQRSVLQVKGLVPAVDTVPAGVLDAENKPSVEDVISGQFIPDSDIMELRERKNSVLAAQALVAANKLNSAVDAGEQSPMEVVEGEVDTSIFLDTITFDGDECPDTITRCTTGTVSAEEIASGADCPRGNATSTTLFSASGTPYMFCESVFDMVYGAFKCSLCASQSGISARCCAFGCTARAHAICVMQSCDRFEAADHWDMCTLQKPISDISVETAETIRRKAETAPENAGSEGGVAEDDDFRWNCRNTQDVVCITCILCPIHHVAGPLT
jgi:hypothetical protein